MARFLKAALAYAAMGLAVFPLRPGGKEPSRLVPPSAPGARDGGVHLATTDAAQIDAWWGAEPDANVAIATGAASGVLVLDVDVKSADGFGSLKAIIAGLPADAPAFTLDTPWQATGQYEQGRGRQYFFAYPPGCRIKNSAGKLGPGLDIRGEGGYVVAAPSIHPSGVAYAWDPENHPRKMAFAPTPGWLLSLLIQPKNHFPVSDKHMPPGFRPSWDAVPEAYARAAIAGEYEAVAGALAGTRNSALNRAAFSLGGLVAVGVLSRALVEETLAAAASLNGQCAEDGPAAIAAVIKSGLEAGMVHPRETPAPTQPVQLTPRRRPQLRVVEQEAPAPGENIAPGQNWRSQYVLTAEGKVKRASFHNAVLMLTDALTGAIAYDDFTSQVMFLAAPPWTLNGFEPRPLLDTDAAAAANWLDANGVTVPARNAHDALLLLANENHINPVRDALGGYQWDGIARLDHWLIDFMGAADTSFVRAVAAKWLIGAVARIMVPGAKVDTMLILEGAQGLRKSMALAALAEFGGRSYFTDDLHALGSKDAALQLHGNVIVELAELDALERSEVKQIKAFLSRQIDKFRKPYGRVVEASPRQCVFAGTLNPDGTGYLRDPTGGRRFWPVLVSHVDVDGVRAVREQLWAEAGARYHAGENWWLDDDVVIAEAHAAQEERQDEDPLAGKLPRWLVSRTETTTQEILVDCWGFLSNQCTAAAAVRVGRSMKRLGWRRVLVRHGQARSWVYRPPEEQPG